MSEDRNKGEELWRFSPVDEYEAPSGFVGSGKVRTKFLDFVRGLMKGKQEQSSPLDPAEDLLSLSGRQLERALPHFDWTHAAGALDRRLRPWLDAERPSKPVVFYVAPPHAGREEILLQWAEQTGAAVVEEAGEDRVLSHDVGWFHSWPEKGPWVLPKLEKCFIRQAEGLDLVRELFAQVLSGTMGRGIIGCDSWPWQFLQRVWLGRPSFTISAQAFKADQLKQLFSVSIPRDGEATPVFRQADNGAYVLRNDDDPEESVLEIFWRRLAAQSRGNVGVAAAYWQQALRRLPDNEIEDDSDEDRSERRETVWVAPWEELTQASVPKEAGETAYFVLHALLVHGGLEVDRLAEILPSDRAAIVEALLFLAEADLVNQMDDEWRVSAFGYPTVRGLLLTNGYLCDSF